MVSPGLSTPRALRSAVTSSSSSSASSSTSTSSSFLDPWLLLLTLGVLATFIWNGVLLEQLLYADYDGERFDLNDTLVLTLSVFNAAGAFTVLVARGHGRSLQSGVPLRHWLVVAATYMGAHRFGLQSLRYLSFPVQIVIKSGKAIPVMLGERLLAGIRHPPFKRAQVVILCVAVAAFVLLAKPPEPKKRGGGGVQLEEGATGEPTSASTSTGGGGIGGPGGVGATAGVDSTLDLGMGLGLIGLALLCDAVYGPMLNRIVEEAKARTGKGGKKEEEAGRRVVGVPNAFHLIFNLNLWQGLLTLPFMLHSGELGRARSFFGRHPEVVPHILQLCGTMALGTVFIFALQRSFGALTVTMTTTLRKLCSVLYSSLFFGHSITPSQWVATVAVFLSGPLGKAVVYVFPGIGGGDGGGGDCGGDCGDGGDGDESQITMEEEEERKMEKSRLGKAE